MLGENPLIDLAFLFLPFLTFEEIAFLLLRLPEVGFLVYCFTSIDRDNAMSLSEEAKSLLDSCGKIGIFGGESVPASRKKIDIRSSRPVFDAMDG